MTRNRKLTLLLLCVLILTVMLTGCMNASNRTPEAEATQVPGALNSASVMPNNTSVVTAAYDWITGSSDVEKKIDLLSEIESSRVVVTGTTALVGVKFAGQYQGEMTERIHDMVASVIQEADPAIKVVAVTSEAEDVEKINTIADQLQKGTPDSELESQIDTIVRNVTTMQ